VNRLSTEEAGDRGPAAQHVDPRREKEGIVGEGAAEAGHDTLLGDGARERVPGGDEGRPLLAKIEMGAVARFGRKRRVARVARRGRVLASGGGERQGRNEYEVSHGPVSCLSERFIPAGRAWCSP